MSFGFLITHLFIRLAVVSAVMAGDLKETGIGPDKLEEVEKRRVMRLALKLAEKVSAK